MLQFCTAFSLYLRIPQRIIGGGGGGGIRMRVSMVVGREVGEDATDMEHEAEEWGLEEVIQKEREEGPGWF